MISFGGFLVHVNAVVRRKTPDRPLALRETHLMPSSGQMQQVQFRAPVMVSFPDVFFKGPVL